jgi:hypothetical protein
MSVSNERNNNQIENNNEYRAAFYKYDDKKTNEL